MASLAKLMPYVLGAAMVCPETRRKLLELPRELFFSESERTLLESMEKKDPEAADKWCEKIGFQRQGAKVIDAVLSEFAKEMNRRSKLMNMDQATVNPCRDPETCGIGPAGRCDQCRDWYTWQEIKEKRALEEMADRERLEPLLANLRRLVEVFPEASKVLAGKVG